MNGAHNLCPVATQTELNRSGGQPPRFDIVFMWCVGGLYTRAQWSLIGISSIFG